MKQIVPMGNDRSSESQKVNSPSGQNLELSED